MLALGPAAAAPPVVFWAPDQVGPGDVTLLYGGGLAAVDAVFLWRLQDAAPGLPPAAQPGDPPAKAARVKPLQPSPGSVKFQAPESLAPGVFAIQAAAGPERSAVRVLNRPELWFAQPIILRPGLAANQAPPGAEIQVVGKNLTVRGDASPRPRLMVRPSGGGAAVAVAVSKAEPFSLMARLPDDLPPGIYELFAHPGKGGPAAWGEPLAIEVKSPVAWPSKQFNVRAYGAKGDDVADDTKAVRDALSAAEKNGGGVVYFPWGTYRLSSSLVVPARTILKGEVRDAVVLKWPLDPPTDDADFTKAAVFIGPECGLEDLTFTARKVEHILLDVQAEFYAGKTVPPEAATRIRPFGRGGDIFLRRLVVHHLLLSGRPEQQKPVTENPKLNKRYWEGLRNIVIHDGRNIEVSDSIFEGGDNQFANLVNARIVRNTFANHMGYCWTALGGGAVDVVCEGNDLKASSSWGWGWVGMQRVYSAHNTTHNFVRGEREAMTLDISSLPSARPLSQYWGVPAEAGVRDGKPFLRFPAGESPDGFRTGWTPGCFKGGTVTIRAFQGGPGAGQSRTIVDNTDDVVFLDKPFAPAPDTTNSRRMYVEVAPRHGRAHFGTTAWLGHVEVSATAAFTAAGADWVPQEFLGMAALILDGTGAGQYRIVTANTKDHAVLDRPWDVPPDATSVVGVWSLMRHMIVYDTKCTDASAFAQMYGAFFDYTVEGCRADRTQGLWGQMGWFVQFRKNLIEYGQSYHPGIGMRGPNPEKNAPFGYTGLDSHRLRITKTAALQYPDRKLPVFADEVLGRPIPTTLAHIQRGNTLRYNQRIVVQPWTGDSAPGPRPGGELFRDVVLDRNTIEHGQVGVQLGPNVGGAVLARNTFRDVARPVWAANAKGTLDLGPADEGETLFASGDLTGWVEEQHDFFKKKHPNASTWSVKEGIVSCDGSLGNCGFLRLDRKLTDFTLRLEYRMSPECNSGVCIRVPAPYNGLPDETLPSKTGYEVQILDDAGAGPSLYSTGALYGAVPPEANAARPAGEWNEMEIVCRGPRIRVTLNGRVVQDVDQTELGAIKDRKRTGYLMLQNHGHATDFRNLRLKDESARK
jgi:hypothetical protein